ncbi:MAG: acyl-CoA reductase [Bacteroidales bacterium]
MNLDKSINAFAILGRTFREAVSGTENDLTKGLLELISNYHQSNAWFTPDNVRKAISAYGDELTGANIKKWLSAYPGINILRPARKVAIIMAGNIPAVGFHDMMCVLLTGNIAVIKASSKDDRLISEIASILCVAEPAISDRIVFADGPVTDFEMVIATGSDNSSRYFEFYFGKYPSLIRRNRTGVALITGNENDAEMEGLGEDVFSYFGLGCRSITKIYMPPKYDLKRLAKAWAKYSTVTGNSKYVSNYQYHKAVMTVNREQFHDAGFVLLRKDDSLFSPVAVINYQEADPAGFDSLISPLSDKIQVVTGRGYTPHGFAQKPKLWDYHDNIDTIGFLLK